MQATIADMLAAKLAQEEQRKAAIAARIEQGLSVQTSNVLSPREMREGIKVMRDKARDQENRQAQLDERNRKLNNDLRALRDERDDCIRIIVHHTLVRKDGRTVCKPNTKTFVANARRELARVNNHISAIEKKMGHTRKLRPRERRDMLIVNGDVGTQELFELAARCRPPRGYPAPPMRRSDTYPEGGTWGKPKGMSDIDMKRGEFDRLATYCETVYNAERACVVHTQGEAGIEISLDGDSLGGVTKENEKWIACPSDPHATPTIHDTMEQAIAVVAISPRVRRMMDQLIRLKRSIRFLGSEKNNRRKQGTRYYRDVNDARDNS
jgi:hypothetical protein